MRPVESTFAQRIKEYLKGLEGIPGGRLQDVLDDDVFEVLAGVAWVREALAESAPSLGSEDQRQVLAGLRTLAT